MEKTISTINGQSIKIIESNGEKLVPIKPICQMLEIAFPTQYDKIKNDEILSSDVTLRVTTGSDGKSYEMVCLPLKFVFGWLFTINPNNVNSTAQESLTNYKLECYNTLFNYFALRAQAFEHYNKQIVDISDKISQAQYEFATTKNVLYDLKNSFRTIRAKTIDEVMVELQTEIKFNDHE